MIVSLSVRGGHDLILIEWQLCPYEKELPRLKLWVRKGPAGHVRLRKFFIWSFIDPVDDNRCQCNESIEYGATLYLLHVKLFMSGEI